MSGAYNSYGGQQYDHPEGYGQQQGGYNNNNYNNAPSAPQHQQQGYGSYPQQGFAPPARADSFGPPQHGGFQHGQAGFNYGTYDASNPQGHAGYYGAQQSNPQYNDAYAQNQAYQASLASGGQGSHSGAHTPQPPYDQAALQEHDFAPQSSDPNAPNYDPKAPPMSEQDRGLLGSLGGGIAGHMLGKRADHGFLGTIGGAILGSLTQDFLKDKKKHSGGSHHHSSHSGSAWGGGSRW